MALSIEQLNEIHLDVLREIGNIGAGNAATALSEMLRHKVDMNVPNVQIMDFSSIHNVLGGAENVVAGVLVQLSGDLEGFMMYTVEMRYAHMLIQLLMGQITELNEDGEAETYDFDEMELSALTEITNILAGSYLSALSTLSGFSINISEPALAIDMAGAILSVPASVFGELSDSALFLETYFIEYDKPILGHFFLIPAMGSFDKLLSALGVV